MPPAVPTACEVWRIFMSKRNTRDLGGMVELVDDDQTARLRGYGQKANTCADLDERKACVRAYRREIASDGRALLHGCEWVRRMCVEREDADDVTACVEAADADTETGQWWSSWAQAVGLGVVAFPSVGALCKLQSRRRRRHGEQTASAAPSRTANAVSDTESAVQLHTLRCEAASNGAEI